MRCVSASSSVAAVLMPSEDECPCWLCHTEVQCDTLTSLSSLIGSHPLTTIFVRKCKGACPMFCMGCAPKVRNAPTKAAVFLSTPLGKYLSGVAQGFSAGIDVVWKAFTALVGVMINRIWLLSRLVCYMCMYSYSRHANGSRTSERPKNCINCEDTFVK